MKYLIMISILGGAYWGYKNYYSVGDISSLSIAEKIETHGSVKASEVLAKSKELVTFICNDDVVLRSWGSSTEACFERVSNFEKMCEKKVFPNYEKKITGYQEAKGLLSRYNKCVIPS